MFKVDREILELIGTCEKISEDFKSKGWMVEVKTEQQGEKLKTLHKLVSEPVEVAPHEQYNQSQGVVTCNLLKNYTEEEIVEGLSSQGVIRCRRIIRNVNSPNPEPTGTLILTFNKSILPDTVTIRTGLRERVRLYIPQPRRCYNCQKYGHSGARCRKPVAVCVRCGLDKEGDHPLDICNRPINCLHCKQPHMASSKTCLKYLTEKEIITIKTKDHLTFSEARARVSLLYPEASKTYASATQQNAQKTVTNFDKNNNLETTFTSTTEPNIQVQQISKNVSTSGAASNAGSVKRTSDNIDSLESSESSKRTKNSLEFEETLPKSPKEKSNENLRLSNPDSRLGGPASQALSNKYNKLRHNSGGQGVKSKKKDKEKAVRWDR